jgi:hypothetical protein
MVHANSHATGAIAWTQDLAAPPRDLLVWAGQVLVVAQETVALHGKDGRRLWERARRSGSPVALGNGRLYLESQSHFLQVVEPSDELAVEKAPLPGLEGSETFLEMIWPRKDDFVVATTMPDPTYDSEEPGPRPKPLITVSRVRYGNNTGDLAEDFEGRLKLPSLFLPERSRWLGLAGNTVISADVQTEKVKRFPLPIDEAVEWSAEPAGLVAVAGTDKGKKVLVAVDVDGAEKWRWVDDGPGEAAAGRPDRWVKDQPPVGAASGRLVVLTTERILAFDGGKLAWQSYVHSEVPGRATLLADGGLLVTSGATLRRIDAANPGGFWRTLPAAIVTSPVVDAEGTIYVATATQLFAIR